MLLPAYQVRQSGQHCRAESHGLGTTLAFLSSFSLSTFPVSRLRVLRPMKEKAGRAEDRVASATGFRVGFAQLTTTIRALRCCTFLSSDSRLHLPNSSFL